MVESRPTSDRSSLRIERAYFTHPSLCLRHYVFQHNSRWTCHGIWAESTRAWLNHSFQSQRWRVWFLDMRFFRITRSILDLSNRSVVCFYGFNDCNSVHYQCGRRSCWYSVSIYSRLTMFSNADATLVGELLSTSVYTVHMLAHDGSNLTNFRTTATLIIYIADVTLSQENEILQIHSVLANSWSPRMHLGTARGLCLELISVSRHCVDETMLSLKDSRHGLSSIYNFVRHIEQSAIYGTVGRCKVLRKHTVTFQPMLILPESFCRPHPCMRWRCWQLRFLQRRGGWRLQAMTCFSLIHYSTQSVRRREKHCSCFDGRSSLTTSIEDCTSLYAFIRSLNWHHLFHLKSGIHILVWHWEWLVCWTWWGSFGSSS